MATITSAPDNSRFKRTRKSLHIDMTPMVDLAFLLLTFFVMTTSLMKQHVLPLNLPHNDTGEPPELKAEQVLNLVLGEENQLYWYVGMAGKKATLITYSPDGIRTLLQEKNRTIAGMHVLVKATNESRYKNIIDILDELGITGIIRYSIVDPEPEDEKLVR